ncbi:MAG: hypothetical protein IJY24_07830 [Clostridia bacterium]|nr:hypothetical protein [Clostridia bacterium]
MDEKNHFVFRPYRIYGWFITLMYIVLIIVLAPIGQLINPFNPTLVISFFIIGILLIFFIKKLYDAYSTTIVFDTVGIQIFEGVRGEYKHYDWDQLAYAYFARNFKAASLLVLSPEPLEQKQVKQYVGKWSWSFARTRIDSVVVIAVDHFPQNIDLKEFLCNRVKTIKSFD